MIVYNKLVRDKIPEIIEASGKKANVRYLRGKEYLKALKNKLVEEANEFLQAETRKQMIEEYADITEVIYAIDDVLCGDLFDTINKVCDTKRNEKGSFDYGCYLESVEDKE